MLDAWRDDYNGVRPHSALANRTPEEFRRPPSGPCRSRRQRAKLQPRTLPLTGGKTGLRSGAMRIGLPRCWAASKASHVNFVLISEALIGRAAKKICAAMTTKMSRRRPK